MTDEQIVEQYDQAAQHTAIGTGFYLDELSRREFQRTSAAALAKAASARRLAIVNALVAVVAVVIAVLVPLLTHSRRLSRAPRLSATSSARRSASRHNPARHVEPAPANTLPRI